MEKNSLIFYRSLEQQALFDAVIDLMLAKDGGTAAAPASLQAAGQLIEIAVSHGFSGNLWQCFLAYSMMNHENAYSLSCEGRKEVTADLYQLASFDFIRLKQLFDWDLAQLDSVTGTDLWQRLCCYQNHMPATVLQPQMQEQLLVLVKTLQESTTPEQFQQAISAFYQHYGVGLIGLNKAFRLDELSPAVHLHPIQNVDPIYFTDIVGYESQKKKLIVNTESFLQGKAANNVLLYGDAGTGKSSSIKAVLNEYYDQGLRLIEIYKHQFRALSTILEQVKDRNYKFIIYMDDLSFEDHELEYKFLKAVLEGGMGKRPDNVLIYATSNRRHLIKEKFSDKKALDDELHGNDTVQEKLSLAARFGISIYFGAPDRKEFEKIVETLAGRTDLLLAEEELLLLANQWELSHGGRSGRAAAQLITHLLGRD